MSRYRARVGWWVGGLVVPELAEGWVGELVGLFLKENANKLTH